VRRLVSPCHLLATSALCRRFSAGSQPWFEELFCTAHCARTWWHCRTPYGEIVSVLLFACFSHWNISAAVNRWIKSSCRYTIPEKCNATHKLAYCTYGKIVMCSNPTAVRIFIAFSCKHVIDCCCCYNWEVSVNWGLQGFWTLSIVWYSKNTHKKHNVSETGSVAVIRWGGGRHLLPWVSRNHSIGPTPHLRTETHPVSEQLRSVVLLEYKTVDNVQKPCNPECYAPSSEPFIIYAVNWAELIECKLEVSYYRRNSWPIKKVFRNLYDLTEYQFQELTQEKK
jgi:hypothetical protein